jgi:CMP-N,N'-diacetyllegionaminic acid synthase
VRILAFIPARGGSKGIPKKNLVPLDGKPLIYYTIEAAKASQYVTDIFISSDDPNVIRYSESLKIEVPYKRPVELAKDDTSTIDTVLHGLEWLKLNKPPLPEAVLLLQPTSPLRTSEDIDGAIKKFLSSKAKSLVSVHKPQEHPYRHLESKGEKWSYINRPVDKVMVRQDYPDNFYIINGAIYLVATEFIFSRKTFVIESETMLHCMPQTNGLDIDEPIDLKWAEFQLKHASIANSKTDSN